MQGKILVDKVFIENGLQDLFKDVCADPRKLSELRLRLQTLASTSTWFDSKLKLSKVELKQKAYHFEGTWEGHAVKGEYPLDNEGSFSSNRNKPMLVSVPVDEFCLHKGQKGTFSSALNKVRPDKLYGINLEVESSASARRFKINVGLHRLELENGNCYQFSGIWEGNSVEGYFWTTPGAQGSLKHSLA